MAPAAGSAQGDETTTSGDVTSSTVAPTTVPGHVSVGSVTTVASGGVVTTTIDPFPFPIVTPPTTTSSGPTSCRTAGLKVAPVATKNQGSTHTETFAITNTTQNACNLAGYPGVAPYRTQAGGGGSSSVQAVVVPIPAQVGAIGAAARLVSLNPGQGAVFFLMWTAPGPSCQLADGVSFNTPVASTYAIVKFPFQFCATTLKESVVLPAGTSA